MATFKAPRGTRDLLPPDTAAWTRLERVAAGPRLVKIGRRLVARPTASPNVRPTLDIATLIEDERNRWP